MKERQIRLKGDAGIFFLAGIFGNFRLVFVVHVVAKDLFVLEFSLLVRCLDDELGRVDIRELRTESIPTTCHLRLVIVVV